MQKRVFFRTFYIGTNFEKHGKVWEFQFGI